MMIKKVLVFLTFICAGFCLFCDTCLVPMKLLRTMGQLVAPKKLAIEGIQLLCMRRYNSKPLCKKVGEEIAPLAIENFFNNYLNPLKKCSIFCHHVYLHYSSEEEAKRILSKQPAKEQNYEAYISRKSLQMGTEKQTLSILHLTDIHLDLNYREKSSINCQYPICCHEEHGFPSNPDAQAKPYGSIKCDTPPKLLNSALQYADGLDPDLIIATGDFSAHDEWEKTQSTIKLNQQYIQQMIKDKFRNQIEVITTPGNNDYVPDHQTDPKILEDLVKVITVNTKLMKVTFISINTVTCDNFNLYLFGDQTYAVYQLKILEQELINNQNIYILGHIPPTLNQCASDYARVYRALITTYSQKIKGQFYGHTHLDQLFINTSPENITVGFGFISGSVSPFFVGKSRLRVYEISEGGVIDYQQHHFQDLDRQTPNWEKEYSFRQKYKLPSTSQPITIQEINNIVHKIFNDEEVQKMYRGTMSPELEFSDVKPCHIYDDPIKFSECRIGSGSGGFSEKLYRLMEFMRGKWSYRQ